VDTGAQFEIIVGDKPRSYRDDVAIAIEAAKYLKERHPTQEVSVRNLQDGFVTVIGWEGGKAVVKA
jgi:hypothetical protein